MLIGLFGYPESGKSEVSKYLRSKYQFERINVGDGMKAMLAGYYRLFGLTEREIERRLYGDLKETPDPMLNGKTPRYALQTIGKEWRDLIDPPLFADRWADRVRHARNAVADGMRYPDELPAFRSLGGVLIQVSRPGHVSPGREHVADARLMLEQDRDAVLLNDGTLEQLPEKIEQLLQSINFERP